MARLTICVTGANGFIGGHIVELLLKRGHNVRGTVRDPSAARNKWLTELGNVQLFEADLTKPGSFDEAFAGCNVVIHTAAVVRMHYDKDPFAEIINPSIQGTRSMMESCRKQKVRKIVLTSSSAVAWQNESDRKKEYRGNPYCEDEWGTFDPRRDPYSYHKCECEKMLMNEWEGEFASLNPAWVCGPLQHATISSSIQLISAICTHEFWPFIPRMYVDVVDVRDVAAAHVACAENKVMTGRYFMGSGKCYSTTDLAECLNRRHPDLKASTRMLPWILMWVVSFFDKRATPTILFDLSVPYPAVSSETLRQNGFKFEHEWEQTLSDTYESFLKFGICKK